MVSSIYLNRQSLTQEVQVQLIDMVHRMITNGNLKFAQLLRNALVEKVNLHGNGS